MSEHMMPIPSRLYNAAVGGHVAGADQIIDDETGLTLDKIAGGALEEKEYTSGSDNGMGRVVLRKNLVNGVNTLNQSMINKSNTIYVIQYDFTLGEDITVPANCILDFQSGSLSGAHTITGQNTDINAGLVKIFNTDVTFAGTWIVSTVYVEWFGAKGNYLNNDTDAIIKSFKFGAGKTVILSTGKVYGVSNIIEIFSNTEIIIDGILRVNSDVNEGCPLEFFSRTEEQPGYTGVHDVYLHGTGTIDANADTFQNSRHAPLRIHHCNRIKIEGITIRNYGMHHAIETGGTKNLCIKNVTFHGAVRNNDYGAICDIQIENISSGGTSGAIPYDNTVTKDVIIDGCVFESSDATTQNRCVIGSFHGNMGDDYFENIIIKNCIFKDRVSNSDFSSDQNSVIYLDWNYKNVLIENNTFINCGGCCIGGLAKSSEIIIKNNKVFNQGCGFIWIGSSANNNPYTNIQIVGNFINGTMTKYSPAQESSSYLKAIILFQNGSKNVVINNNYIILNDWKSAIVYTIGGATSMPGFFVKDEIIVGIENLGTFKEVFLSHLNRFTNNRNAIVLGNNSFVSVFDMDNQLQTS